MSNSCTLNNYTTYGGIYGPQKIKNDNYIDFELKKNTIPSKYYNLFTGINGGDVNTTINEINNTFNSNNKELAKQQIPEDVYINLLAFIPELDWIREWVRTTYGTNYELWFENVWRHQSNKEVKSSFHGSGNAADLHINYMGAKVSDRNKYYNEMFDAIMKTHPNRKQITELLLERSSSGSIWIHFAIALWSDKHIVCKEYDGTKGAPSPHCRENIYHTIV